MIYIFLINKKRTKQSRNRAKLDYSGFTQVFSPQGNFFCPVLIERLGGRNGNLEPRAASSGKKASFRSTYTAVGALWPELKTMLDSELALIFNAHDT